MLVSSYYILTIMSRFRQHISSFLYENVILILWYYSQQNRIKSIKVVIFYYTSAIESKNWPLHQATQQYQHNFLPCISSHSYTTIEHNRHRGRKKQKMSRMEPARVSHQDFSSTPLFVSVNSAFWKGPAEVPSQWIVPSFGAEKFYSSSKHLKHVFNSSCGTTNKVRSNKIHGRIGLLHSYGSTTHRDIEAYRSTVRVFMGFGVSWRWIGCWEAAGASKYTQSNRRTPHHSLNSFTKW